MPSMQAKSQQTSLLATVIVNEAEPHSPLCKCNGIGIEYSNKKEKKRKETQDRLEAPFCDACGYALMYVNAVYGARC